MESAIFGLVGVVIGGLLNIAKDWWIEGQNKAKNAEYLSIQIACALERYAFNCAEVVQDDGTCCGQPDKDGWYIPQITPPEFDPMSFDVEWKSLPVELMYEILNFPYKAKLGEQQVTAVFEYGDGPPDFPDGFKERQWQYATLGLAAWELAENLRKHIKIELLPKNVGNWNPIADMEERKSAIDSQRAKN
jgi:hypothetical protein